MSSRNRAVEKLTLDFISQTRKLYNCDVVEFVVLISIIIKMLNW